MKKIFEAYLKLKKLLTPASYDYYSGHVKYLLKNVVYSDKFKIKSLKDFDKDFCRKFILEERKQNVSDSTINKRIKLIKNLLRENEVITNIFAVKAIKTAVNSFKPLDEEMVNKIISYVEKEKNTPGVILKKVLLLLLIETGARISEILNITCDNIKLGSDISIIRLIKTKSKKPRNVYFTSYTASFIKMLLKDQKSKYLLYDSVANKKMNYSMVLYFLDKFSKKHNFVKITPHRFRHYFASKLNKSGMMISEIAKLLGHSSIKTTEIYIHLDDEDILENYKKYYKVNYKEQK